MKRASGILLHITSLPNDEGVGTIGHEAYEFIDLLNSAKIKNWQLLPIGPTGYGDSPYASFSAFAGNPYLINLDKLCEKKFLTSKEVSDYKKYAKSVSTPSEVNFGFLYSEKIPLLKKAAGRILNLSETDAHLKQSINDFLKSEDFWLADFALFTVLKEVYQNTETGNGAWNYIFPEEIILRNKSALEKFKEEYKRQIDEIKIIQFIFYSQWYELKNYAEKKGIVLIGDIPIFVASDSVDVWANQNLFDIDKNRFAKNVAGVPPDFFSSDGQLWGNPLYNWEEMKKDNYLWWKNRIRQMLKLFNIIRIDHFRGFESFWSIPAYEKTAQNGKWIKGPCFDFFNAIKQDISELNSSYMERLPLLAEDLGIITDEVIQLRDTFNLPGMKILQFAFDINEFKNGRLENKYLPHNCIDNCVLYTGTHDNDTLLGYVDNLSEDRFNMVYAYAFGKTELKKTKSEKTIKNLCIELMRLCFASSANTVILQMQDILFLNSDSRMNTPSTVGQNWKWRMRHIPFNSTVIKLVSDWNLLYGRSVL